MTANNLTAVLAQRVMGWTVGPDRYLMNRRRWLPKWRFQPTKDIADAFRLLEAASVVEYLLRADRNGLFSAKVRVRGEFAQGSGSTLPFAICVAVAHAYGISVGAGE